MTIVLIFALEIHVKRRKYIQKKHYLIGWVLCPRPKRFVSVPDRAKRLCDPEIVLQRIPCATVF